MKTMNGTVVGFDGRYFRIETDGPPHLRTLDLVRFQMGRAVVGDRVELVYVTTPSTGLWNVHKVVAS